jgi:hypothetical protein
MKGIKKEEHAVRNNDKKLIIFTERSHNHMTGKLEIHSWFISFYPEKYRENAMKRFTAALFHILPK